MSDDRFSEENQRSFVKYGKLKPKVFDKSKSRHALGTPVVAETLFQAIEDNKTETPVFKWARKLMSKFTDDEIWEMYDHWLQGKIHEKLRK